MMSPKWHWFRESLMRNTIINTSTLRHNPFLRRIPGPVQQLHAYYAGTGSADWSNTALTRLPILVLLKCTAGR